MSRVGPMSNLKQKTMEIEEQITSPSDQLIDRISDIVEEYRARAQDISEDIMAECFSLLGEVLSGNDSCCLPSEYVAGLSPATLKALHDKASGEHFNDWLCLGMDGLFLPAFLEFMDFNALNRKAFRKKFPRAYCKWNREEDDELMRVYADADKFCEKMDGRLPDDFWSSLSERFQRNRNAIKLRLARLGVDLGADAAPVARY